MTILPVELTDRVIDCLHADKRSLAACSLVCRSWIPASRYHSFQELTITPANAQSFLKLLESATTQDAVGLNRQQSKIKITSRLRGGIDFFNYVRSIILAVDPEPEWLKNSIMQAIASLPFLSEFSIIRLGYPLVNPPLEILKNLKKLSIDGRDYNVIRGIAAVVANSPELEHLDFSSGQYYDYGEMPRLQDLFADTSPDSPPLKLQHLAVGNIHLAMDASIIPHFRSLTSLELIEPCEVPPGDYATTSAVIWLMLKSEGIQLSRLITSMMNDGLLEFLSSFQGLTHLCLEWATGNDDEDSDRLARTFFEVALPRHADTLQILRIEAAYEGDWCFGKHNLVSIMNCMRLDELAISLCWPPLSDYSDSDPVDLLLDNTSQLHHLRSLEILAATKPDLRHSHDGYRIVRHDNSVYAAIFNALDGFEELDGDDDVPGLPGYEVRVYGLRMFVPRTIGL